MLGFYPIFSHLPSVQHQFVKEMEQRTEMNQKFYYLEVISNSWLFQVVNVTVLSVLRTYFIHRTTYFLLPFIVSKWRQKIAAIRTKRENGILKDILGTFFFFFKIWCPFFSEVGIFRQSSHLFRRPLCGHLQRFFGSRIGRAQPHLCLYLSAGRLPIHQVQYTTYTVYSL